jgi:hypothetical protein
MSPKSKSGRASDGPPVIEPENPIDLGADVAHAVLETAEKPAEEQAEQTVKISVYLPLGLAEKLAAYSVRYRCDRSHVIATCLQAFIGSIAISFRRAKAPEDLRVA